MNTPIITGADAEGAGEMFQVSNLDWNNLLKMRADKWMKLRISLARKPI